MHAFVSSRKLILGGIEIEHSMGLAGHSDADVLLHALIDALLGACGKPDIGQVFPNTDMCWKDAQSIDLLKQVWSEISAQGWSLVNLDISILLEAPKLAPYISRMKEKIAHVLDTEIGRCSIKATTSERLGFVGRGEGCLATCVVLLERCLN